MRSSYYYHLTPNASVGTNTELIIKEANVLLHDLEQYEAMAQASNPYGTGNACVKIIDSLIVQ